MSAPSCSAIASYDAARRARRPVPGAPAIPARYSMAASVPAIPSWFCVPVIQRSGMLSDAGRTLHGVRLSSRPAAPTGRRRAARRTCTPSRPGSRSPTPSRRWGRAGRNARRRGRPAPQRLGPAVQRRHVRHRADGVAARGQRHRSRSVVSCGGSRRGRASRPRGVCRRSESWPQRPRPPASTGGRSRRGPGVSRRPRRRAPRLRQRAADVEASVVMFWPKTISSGSAPVRSAAARRASAITPSVSSLLGNAPWVLLQAAAVPTRDRLDHALGDL